jgi:hypothetical protein
MIVSGKLEGWEELQKVLKEMPASIEKRVIKKGIVDAAEMLVVELKATKLFKDNTGNLRKSIRPVKRGMKKGVIRGQVIAGAPHARLVEFGYMKKLKTGTFNVPGKYFMKKTFEQNRQKLIDGLKTKLEENVKKYQKRMARKAAKAAKVVKA